MTQASAFDRQVKKGRNLLLILLKEGLKIVTKHSTDLRCTPKIKNQTEVLPPLGDFIFTCPI